MIQQTKPREVHTLRHTRTNVLGMTQDQLSEKLGVSVRTYIRYEQADAMPPTASILLDMIIKDHGKLVIPPAKAPVRSL